MNEPDRLLEAYMKDIKNTPVLSEEEKRRLARMTSAGDMNARNRLVMSHLRFVVFIAKRYKNRGVPMIDLVNEGNVGLLRAAEKFDADRGFQFTTYAVWWVRQRMLQAIARDSHVIRLPANKKTLQKKLLRKKDEYWETFGRGPTTGELALLTGAPEEDVDRLLQLAAGPLSLEKPVSIEGEGTLSDYIVPEDPNGDPERSAMEESMKSRIREAVEELGEREATVIRLHFGIDDDRRRSLEEIGGMLNLSRERIRQIKNGALRKLAQGETRRTLESYLTS